MNKVTYATLFVSDQDKALDFYTSKLGFEKRADNPTPDDRSVRFLAVGIPGNDVQIVLWPGTAGTGKPGQGHVPGAFIIDTTDCRADFETLKARGVEFETPDVLEQPWALVAVLKDVDGNRLTLRQNR